MTPDLNCDVLIVGAGPTGLMAANQLMRFGIDFIIIDEKSGPTKESRAIAVTARSLEIYQQMGLAEEAIAQGARINSFNLYFAGKRKVEVLIGEIGQGISEFSYMLAFEQSKNEELLSNNLHKNGKEVHWQTRFIELSEENDWVRTTAQYNDNLQTISSRYVIACDGASSPIRQQLNFSFAGGTYVNKFFVADTILKWDLEYDKLVIAPGNHNFSAFLPMAGDNCYRVLGTLPKEYFEKENITFKDIEGTIRSNLGVKLSFESVNWFSVYKLHHRGVDHFRNGRVFLAGDSAHIHSPAGGQGMNTGLQDAYNLCWKLAFVIKNWADKSLLDTYNEERLPFAKWLLQFTDRGFNAMTNDNWFFILFRKYVAMNLVGVIASNKWVRPFIYRIISQTWYSYKRFSLSKTFSHQRLKIKAGDRLPYFSEGNIYSSFTAATFHLLHIGENQLEKDAKETAIQFFPFPIEFIENELDSKWQRLGVKRELYILVRPDNYIALISDTLNKGEIDKYLEKYFPK